MYRACFLLLLGLTALPMMWGQAPDGDSAPPLLTLDEAVRIASGNNRDVRISERNVTKTRETVAQARTNYLPKLDSYVLAGAPLQSLNFTVPAGSFGVYPNTGPIPRTDSAIRSPQRFSAFVYATAAQPLTQLYKMNLAVQQARLGTDLAQEGVRAQQQETRPQMKEAYYRVYSVEVTLANPEGRLKEGMIATLALEESRPQEITAIPLAAVLRSPQDPNAFLVMTPESVSNI